MLPGFRFLFAAIVLSMSLLVFGLGAAALLRAAHEEFASIPAWHAAPETRFAQQGDVTGPALTGPLVAEPAVTEPVLAMLRVDTPVEQKAPDNIPAVAAPTEQAAIVSTPAEPETIAEPKPGDSPLLPTAKPETPVAESPAQSETPPAQADAPAAARDATIAATAAVLSPMNEAAPTASEPASAPALPDSGIVSTKIATLGGPPVAIEVPPPAKSLGAKALGAKASSSAKPDKSAIKKRLQARRAIQRRKIAQRARVAQRASLQPADPFALPVAAARSR